MPAFLVVCPRINAFRPRGERDSRTDHKESAIPAGFAGRFSGKAYLGGEVPLSRPRA